MRQKTIVMAKKKDKTRQHRADAAQELIIAGEAPHTPIQEKSGINDNAKQRIKQDDSVMRVKIRFWDGRITEIKTEIDSYGIRKGNRKKVIHFEQEGNDLPVLELEMGFLFFASLHVNLLTVTVWIMGVLVNR